MQRAQSYPFRVATYLSDELMNKIEEDRANIKAKAVSVVAKKIVMEFLRSKKIDFVVPPDKQDKLCNSCNIFFTPNIFKLLETTRRGQKRSCVVRYIIKEHYKDR